MKKHLLFVSLCLAAGLLLCGCKTEEAPPADTGPVRTPLPELTAAQAAFVEDVTDRKIEDLCMETLARVKTISIVGDTAEDAGKRSVYYDEESGRKIIGSIENVHDLSALYLFPNVTEFGVYCCPGLTDLSALKHLPKIQTLTLIVTGVTDLTVLGDLSELELLEVKGSPVEKISLPAHNHLTKINIGGASLTDLSFLEQCGELTSLVIEYNKTPIKNPEKILSLTGLTWLSFMAPDTDFSFLQKLSAPVKTLWVGGASDIDLTLSDTLKDTVTQVSVDASDFVNLDPLADCKKLSKISLFTAPEIQDTHGLSKSESIYFIEAVRTFDLYAWWNPEG